MLQFSHRLARHLMLATLGLSQPPREEATKKAVLAAIQQMHLLQIDTISVVARSHHFVLWSRLGSYRPEWLDELLEEKHLFEYWSHAACFLPVEDYPIYRRQMLDHEHAKKWLRQHQGEAEVLLSHIQTRGPVRAADFERENKARSQGWWDWKPEKVALEVLFRAGELMVARRHNFQRYYDLQARVLPHWDDTGVPSRGEAELIFARKALKALGVAQAKWLANYFYRPQKSTLAALATLVKNDEAVPVRVEGWPEKGYIHRDNLPLVEAGLAGRLAPHLTALLSPFDPLISDRERVYHMFGFEYNIECYTPAPKRRYGYFTLPILHKGELIGRLDAKAHRREKVFEVIKLHLEPGTIAGDEVAMELATCLKRCAVWHNTPRIIVRWSDPPEFMERLQPFLI